jgi:hypothetical protein
MKIESHKVFIQGKKRNLLGLVVSSRGIKVDSNKVKVIKDMLAPKIEKEVGSFLGHLNYIARFISQVTMTCEPIF